MRTEYCLSERKRLESECEVARLCAQVFGAKAIKKLRADEIDALKQRNVALESEKNSVNGKVHALETTCSSLHDQVAKLDVDLLEMALHLEEKFYPHLLNTISGRRWLLTRGVKLAVVKCLNSQEYLTALGSAISRAIEKGMQDGLSASIDHEKAGRGLEDVDASIVDIMNLLRLESPLVDAPGMSHLQPDVEQLTLPIHEHEDQVVLGETYLSFALSVAHSRVERIRKNVAA
ncbi:hypothetical protein Tco_1061642 [Tanacetum coccineum]